MRWLWSSEKVDTTSDNPSGGAQSFSSAEQSLRKVLHTMKSIYMLPTELQPLDRFKAVRPVLKPSSRFQSHPCQRTYTCTHIYCSACRAWSTHVCCVCNVYDTASCREACGVVVYRECLFFMYRSCTGAGDNICLLFVPPAASIKTCSVCGEHYHRHAMCLLEMEVSIFNFCCQDCKEKK